MRPLDWLPSIKLKVSAGVLAAIGATVVLFWSGVKLGVWPSICGALAGSFALLLVRLIAHGMTSPLREMADAAGAMARGDYEQRVTATSFDEVGDLARAFNAMSEALSRSNRIQRDLIANVSHELRTPITALQAHLENLVDGIEPADPDVLRVMLRQVDRLRRLVVQLLDLSRLEAGTVPLQVDEVPLAVLLEDAVAEIRLQNAAVAVTITVDPPDLMVEADGERIHQVVVNLLENAVRHSPPGEVVEVRATLADGIPSSSRIPSIASDGSRRRFVRLDVDDSGPGIAAADAERVFERFYRSDSARASRDGGSGLGLAIARWIVDLHQGRIWTESREPQGCRMSVELPARSTEAIGFAESVAAPLSAVVRPEVVYEGERHALHDDR